MHRRAQKLFYSLAIFVCMNALFVMQNSHEARNTSHVTELRQEIRQAFSQAFIQTIGDQSWVTPIEVALRGVFEFYDQSANAMVALLEPTSAEGDVLLVFEKSSKMIAGLFGQPTPSTNDQGKIAGLLWEGEFMQKEPLYSPVPGYVHIDPRLSDQELSDLILSLVILNSIQDPETGFRIGVRTDTKGSVAGLTTQEPVNNKNEWVTVQDNFTGELYCLAIYNQEINKYSGPCVYDPPH